jgi:hypothetical protein
MSCWQRDSKLRPSFATINARIDEYLEELAGYMNIQSFLFPEIRRQQLEQLRQEDEEGRSPSRSSVGSRNSVAVAAGTERKAFKQSEIAINVITPSPSPAPSHLIDL